MTKSEAIAITNALPKAQQNIQEVQLRLKMHQEGTIELNENFLTNSVERLNSAAEAVDLVCRMAYAEIE